MALLAGGRGSSTPKAAVRVWRARQRWLVVWARSYRDLRVNRSWAREESSVTGPGAGHIDPSGRDGAGSPWKKFGSLVCRQAFSTSYLWRHYVRVE